MDLTRRSFLKWASLSAVGAVACGVFDEREMNIQSPVNLPEDLVSGQDNWYATLCGQCPEREGILVRVMEGRAKKVRGNPAYPTNLGKQSVRCDGELQATYHPNRLARPILRQDGTPRGGREYWELSWDEAVDLLRDRLAGLRSRNEADTMRIVTEPLRGHLGMVVGRFADSFGGNHLALEPLEQQTLSSTFKRVFDQDTMPGLDIANSGYLLSFGADFLSTWLSPVHFARGYGQFRSSRNGRSRGRHIHVDPRYSMTAAAADEWIPITPGKEGILALTIAHILVSKGLADAGAAEALLGTAGARALEDFSPEKVLQSDSPLYLGMPETIRGEDAQHILERIAEEFATMGPGLAIGGGEAGAHTNGRFNLSAIYALNHLVGSAGRQPGQGGVVFNPTPPIDGLKNTGVAGSPADWERMVDDLKSGRTKVLMVHGANPLHSLPTAAGFRDALEGSSAFVVSFSSFLDDTSLMADLVLPVRSHLEEWGDDIPQPGPGFQVMGIQQPVVNPLGDLDPRSFADTLLALSQELDLDDAILRDARDFQGLLRGASDTLFALERGSPRGGSEEAPTKSAFWNKLLQQGGWWDEDSRATDPARVPPGLLAELAGQPAERRLPSYSGPTGPSSFHLVPFLSNSLLDGRASHLPWLQAAPDPLTTVTWQTWIEINSRLVEEMGLKEGDEVLVTSNDDSVKAVVYPHPAVPRGVVCLPAGQGHIPEVQYATRDGQERGSNPLKVLAMAKDAETGSLAWAATRVLVQPTGQNIKVSKFEGIVPAYPIGTKEEDIIHVTGEAT